MQMKRLEMMLWPAVMLAVMLVAWELAVKWTQTGIFPSPVQVITGARELVRKGLLFGYVVDSLGRVSQGYLTAVVLGLPAGLLLGWYPLAGKAFNPIIQMMRPISPLAWIPVTIVWFGVGPAAPIFLIFLASFFPIVIAASNGVRNVPPMFRNAGQNFGLSPSALLRRVIFPAAFPRILIGLRIALGVAWLVVVAAEMIAVDSGLGYLIIDSRNAGKRYDLVVAAMVMIGLIGLLLNFLVQRVSHLRAVRWGFREES